MSQKTAAPRPARRRPYRTPALTVHGDLRAMTAAKSGNKGDGAGKPSTRQSGGNA